MKLYLLRHATAVDVARSDSERELTAEGREEARVTGRALQRLGAKPPIILASPLVRARQTAEIAARELDSPAEVTLYAELCNGRSTLDLLRGLRPHAQAREILMVGHMPDLADHLARIIGAEDAGGLSFGRGTLCCVQMNGPVTGRGELRWFLRQKQQRLLY